MKTCPKCQASCDDHMKFCLNCGEPFPEETIAEAAAENTEKTQEIVLETAEKPVEKAEEAAEAAAGKAEEAQTAAAAMAAGAAQTAAGAVMEEAEEEPPLTPEELKAAKKFEKEARKEAEREAQQIEAARKKAEKDAQKRAEKAIAVRKKAGSRQPMSVLAVLAIIFAVVGVFAGGYACLLSFMNLGIAVIFYLPSVLGILFGFLALRSTGRDMIYRGRILAFLGIVIGAVAIVLWIIGTFMLRHYTAVEFGSLDLMNAIQTIIRRS